MKNQLKFDAVNTATRQSPKIPRKLWKKKVRELTSTDLEMKLDSGNSMERFLGHRRIESDAYLPKAITNYKKLREAISIKPYKPYSLLKKRQFSAAKVIQSGSISDSAESHGEYAKALQNLVKQSLDSSNKSDNLLKDLVDQSQSAESREFYFAGVQTTATSSRPSLGLNLVNQNYFLRKECIRIISKAEQQSRKHRQIKQNLGKQITEMKKVMEGLRKEVEEAAQARGISVESQFYGKRGFVSNGEENRDVSYGIQIPRIKML